jgi:hypothetical protein
MDEPLRTIGSYVVIGYRFGHIEGHSYLIDLCAGIDEAVIVADKEATERGGKYSVVVFAKRADTGDIDEVYEAESPYKNKTVAN